MVSEKKIEMKDREGEGEGEEGGEGVREREIEKGVNSGRGETIIFPISPEIHNGNAVTNIKTATTTTTAEASQQRQ